MPLLQRTFEATNINPWIPANITGRGPGLFEEQGLMTLSQPQTMVIQFTAERGIGGGQVTITLERLTQAGITPQYTQVHSQTVEIAPDRTQQNFEISFNVRESVSGIELPGEYRLLATGSYGVDINGGFSFTGPTDQPGIGDEIQRGVNSFGRTLIGIAVAGGVVALAANAIRRRIEV